MATPTDNERRIIALEACLKTLVKDIADAIRRSNTYLALDDTVDDTYDQKLGRVPMVTFSELISTIAQEPDVLTLLAVPLFQDLFPGNAIIRGGVSSVSVSGNTYFVFSSKYIIDGVLYDQLVSGNVTLANGHATLKRIDVFVINNDGDTSVTPPSVGFVQGTASANPKKPDIDLSKQVEVSFKLLLPGETSPPDINEYLVYDENIEWTNTSATENIDLDYLTNPDIGLKSMLVPTPSSLGARPLAEWINSVLIQTTNLTSKLLFRMVLEGPMTRQSRIVLIIKNATTLEQRTLTLRRTNLIDYGFDISIDANYQTVTIPISAFSSLTLPNLDMQLDIVSFEFIRMPEIQIDNIRFQDGLSIPNNENEERLLSINTVWVDGTNGSDATGVFGDITLPFATVTEALKSMPIPASAAENSFFNARLFHIIIVDDAAQTINEFTSHNIRFYSAAGAKLTLDNTGTGFSQTNFGDDVSYGKEVIFDMGRSEIVFKKTTSGTAVILKALWSRVHFNVQKIKCETIDPIDFGLKAGMITGDIYEMECDKSGLHADSYRVGSVNTSSHQEFILDIKRITMLNTVISGRNEISANLDCVAVKFNNSNAFFYFILNITHIDGPTGQTGEAVGVFGGTGRFLGNFFIHLQTATRVRLYEKAIDFTLEFHNSFLTDVRIGAADLGGDFGSNSSLIKGTIGMFVITDPTTWTRFNLYDHLVAANLANDLHSLTWSVTILDFRVEDEPADNNALIFFDAPSGLTTSNHRTANGSGPGAHYIIGFRFVDAKFYNVPIRILGTAKATVNKNDNYRSFLQESLYFQGHCVFDGIGEFLILSNPAKQKRIEIVGSLEFGEYITFDTAGNLEIETMTREIADNTFAATGPMIGQFLQGISTVTGDLIDQP